jgi:site-specific recombinase XerD
VIGGLGIFVAGLQDDLGYLAPHGGISELAICLWVTDAACQVPDFPHQLMLAGIECRGVQQVFDHVVVNMRVHVVGHPDQEHSATTYNVERLLCVRFGFILLDPTAWGKGGGGTVIDASDVRRRTVSDLVMVQMPVMVVLEEQPLDHNPAAVYLAGVISEKSRRTYRQALDEIATMLLTGTDAKTFPWAELRYQHVVAIRSMLAENNAPSTVNKKLAALRGVLECAWKLEQMSAEEYMRATSVKGIKYSRLPHGRFILAKERAALIHTCRADSSALGIRDVAVMTLLFSTGLRVTALCQVDLGDVNITLNWIRAIDKGNKESKKPLNPETKQALENWLEVRGGAPGPLFWPARKGGTVRPGRLSQQSVDAMLQARAQRAGLGHLSAHDFRRTFATRLLQLGIDVFIVQRLMGHESSHTTERYDFRSDDVLRDAVQLLHVLE